MAAGIAGGDYQFAHVTDLTWSDTSTPIIYLTGTASNLVTPSKWESDAPVTVTTAPPADEFAWLRGRVAEVCWY